MLESRQRKECLDWAPGHRDWARHYAKPLQQCTIWEFSTHHMVPDNMSATSSAGKAVRAARAQALCAKSVLHDPRRFGATTSAPSPRPSPGSSRREAETPPRRAAASPRHRYVLIGLVCLLNACAAPDRQPPPLPVLPATTWHTSAPPQVEAVLLHGAAAEALWRASPRRAPSLSGGDVANAALALGYSCAYALCVGGPILVGIGQAHLAMTLPPLAAKLDALVRDPAGPLAQGLAQRLESGATPPGSATLRLETALLLDGVDPSAVCLSLRTRIELQDGGRLLYREFISIGGPLTTAGTPKTECRSLKQWLANDAVALPLAIQTYANALPALVRSALPGWTSPP